MIQTIKKDLKSLRKVSTRLGEKLLNGTARIHEAPIFVLGNQKSGTSAIAALLAKSVGKTVTSDIRGLYEPTQTRLHKGEISFSTFISRNKLDFSREVIKDPNLTFLYHELTWHFPDSRMIFINRDPRANIRSILNRLSLPGDLPRLEELHLEYVPQGWGELLEGSWTELEGENYIEMMAARWNLAADTYLENAHNMALVRYEDFCEDKVGEIARLARRVGLEPVNDISDKVDHQYQRRGDRNISWQEFFGAENLSRIERVCGERMKRFGYEPSEG